VFGNVTRAATPPGGLVQLPELAGETESVEDRLVLLARAGSPLRREAIAPPVVRELAQLADGDRRSGCPPLEPPFDVLGLF